MFKASHTLNCTTPMTQYTIIPPFDHMGTVGSGGDIVVVYTPKTPMIARFFVQIFKEQTNRIPSKRPFGRLRQQMVTQTPRRQGKNPPMPKRYLVSDSLA